MPWYALSDASPSLPNGTRTALTHTRPAFVMPYVDPALDLGVSRSMEATKAIEPANALFWHRALLEPCQRGEIFLDVGANFGYYTLLAAVMGCRVVSWEPVPAFRALLSLKIRLNNVSDRVHVRAAVVSDDSSVSQVELAVPHRGLWGTASLRSMDNVDATLSKGTVEVVTAKVETVDETVDETAGPSRPRADPRARLRFDANHNDSPIVAILR